MNLLRRRRQREARSRLPKDSVLWIVNQYATPLDTPGITRHVELADQLVEHGWATRIFAAALHHTTSTLTRDVSPLRPVQDDPQGRVAFTWLWSSRYRRNGWRRYLNMLTYTSTLLIAGWWRDRPDAVIGSSPHLLAGFGGWLLARRHRVPFLFEVRDVWPDMLVQLGLKSPAVIKPLTMLEHFLYRKADTVIALTDGIAERIEAKGVTSSKIEVVPNATLRPAPLDDTHRADMRRRLGWDDKVVLVWAGSHNPMNGLDVVVEAARLMQDRDDVLVVFIGDGSLKEDLIEQARGLKNVVFEDPLPKTEIGAWLRAADIGLIHSRKFEVFTGARPNKLFDYMAAGLPMVSTVPGEAWRLIEEANAGVFAQWEDPGALADAVRNLADSPVRRREMGRNGFDAVTRVHSREATAAHLADVVNRLCAAHKYRAASPDTVTPQVETQAGTSRVMAGATTRRGGINANAAD